jgi:uncharacterized protein (TIGR03435 family)
MPPWEPRCRTSILKLEPRKVLVDTLVIDNLSKIPTEN